MKTYKVTIDYKKGVSFSCNIQAFSEKIAESIAHENAYKCGFLGVPKKTTVREIYENNE